jgi:hypothetical protein
MGTGLKDFAAKERIFRAGMEHVGKGVRIRNTTSE